jgi:hypothetical protein
VRNLLFCRAPFRRAHFSPPLREVGFRASGIPENSWPASLPYRGHTLPSLQLYLRNPNKRNRLSRPRHIRLPCRCLRVGIPGRAQASHPKFLDFFRTPSTGDNSLKEFIRCHFTTVRFQGSSNSRGGNHKSARRTQPHRNPRSRLFSDPQCQPSALHRQPPQVNPQSPRLPQRSQDSPASLRGPLRCPHVSTFEFQQPSIVTSNLACTPNSSHH